MPIYALLLWRFVRATPAQGVVAGAAVNLVSHPLGFLVLTPALRRPVGAAWTLALVEVVAWVGEALLLGIRWRRQLPLLLAISYVANAASFLAGLLVFR